MYRDCLSDLMHEPAVQLEGMEGLAQTGGLLEHGALLTNIWAVCSSSATRLAMEARKSDQPQK